jgi:hypothetical protein
VDLWLRQRLGVASEQGHEHLGVRAAPAGYRVPARACPVAGDRPAVKLGRVGVTGGDVVEGLVVVRTAGDLVDRRVDKAEVASRVLSASAMIPAHRGALALVPPLLRTM